MAKVRMEISHSVIPGCDDFNTGVKDAICEALCRLLWTLRASVKGRLYACVLFIGVLSLASSNLGLLAMGLITGSFKFLMGMGCGVYVAQNYNVPNVKKLFNTYVFLAKHLEETYRKPKKDDDGHTP